MSEPETQEEIVTEQVPQQTETQAPVRDADDEVLDRLFADDDAPEEAQIPARESAAPSPTKTVSKERERAISILKRDGVPDEVIEAANDTTLQAWADKAAKRQKDVDGYGKKMADLEKQLKAPKSKEPAGADDVMEDDRDDAEPSLDSTDGSAEDPWHSVQELLGEDAVKPIRAMQSELAELRKWQSAAAEQSLLAQVDAADAYFRSQYGDGSPERDAVVAEMNRLGTEKPGTYLSVMHLAEEAYANLAGKRKPNAERRKSFGQPTVARGVSRSERPRTPVDAEDAILDAILDGKSRDEAMRLIRK
jgi:hypothetical protein